MNKLHEKKGWVDYLIYAIWAFFLFAGIYDLFVFPLRSISWFVELILAVFIYYYLKVPKWVYFCLMGVFLSYLLGELFLELFYLIPIYDKIVHALSPLLACTFFYFLFDKKIENKKILILLSAGLLLSFELVWEIIEYFSDSVLGTNLTGVYLEMFNESNTGQIMTPYEDTIYDMVFNLIGSIVWAVIALFATKDKKDKGKR